MTSSDRIGTRAIAWSEADRAAIFCHILELEIALHTALGMLRNSAYALRMRDTFGHWEALLEAVPPQPRNLP